MWKVPEYRIALVREGSYNAAEHPVLKTPFDVYQFLKPYFADLDREHCVVLFLNTKFKVIGMNTVAIGSLSEAVVHPREVFKGAVLLNAANILIAHNHPSGDSTPSMVDIELTRRLRDAGNILGIGLLDHVILGNDQYHSTCEVRTFQV